MPTHVTAARLAASTLAALGALSSVAACDTGSTTIGAPPSFSIPVLKLPTTLPPPDEAVIVPGPALTLTSDESPTVATDLAPPLIDAEVPDPVIDMDLLPVPDEPPPDCAVMLAAVSVVTGPMTSPAGEEPVDAAAGHEYSKCYANVLAPSNAPLDAYSYSFEIWSFAAGGRPQMLTNGSSPFTDPASYATIVDPRVSPDSMSWTPADLLSARGAATGRRAAYFPCGGGECWLYLDVGAATGGSVAEHLDTSIITIATSLATQSDDATTGATGGAAPTRPTCAEMRAPIEAILDAFKLQPLRLEADEVDLDTSDYIGCQGSLLIRPPSPLNPNPSLRTIAYTIFVVDPARPALLNALPSADIATPELGEGVFSDGGSFVVDGPPGQDALATSTAARIVRYSCGAFVCWVSATEWAYVPVDTSIAFLDAQLKQYITLSRTYISSLPSKAV